MEKLSQIEKTIGYVFKDKTLLKTALTHSSYANERKIISNERLEFLGDSVLGMITATKLYKDYPDMNEGNLTKLRASLVCEQSLFEISKKINLSQFILLGHGEEIGGGRERPSVVSDAFEALLAAVFLDAGIEKAKSWLLDIMKDAFCDAKKGNRNKDYKTQLQEMIQKDHLGTIEYRVSKQWGPDHDKHFEIEVMLNKKVIGKAEGTSKKEAQQNAAKEAIEQYEIL